MELTIHRGTHEIGGTCIELTAAGGERLVLDLGMPLDDASSGQIKALAGDSAKGRAQGLLPRVAGLYRDQDGPRPLALLLSHDHQDHTGLLPHVHPEVMVGLGGKIRTMWELCGPVLRYPDLGGRPLRVYDGSPFELGPFRITPHVMDHSAFDAHALEIAADGRRLFYSGDFRSHGRKGSLFDAFCRKPPAPVDALVMEGTTLSRPDVVAMTEKQLEAVMAGRLKAVAGPAFAIHSPMNLDRLVTLYRAATKAGRKLFLDSYGAWCVEAYREAGVSLPPLGRGPRDIGVLMVRHLVLDRPEYEGFRAHLVRDIADRYDTALGRRSLITLRKRMLRHLDKRAEALRDGLLFYSMWPGYLQKDLWPKEFAAGHGLAFEIAHTSGHADTGALQRLGGALRPGAIIPVHTENPDRFAGLFPGVPVRCLADGEPFRFV